MSAKDQIDRLRILQSNRTFFETDWDNANRLALIDTRSIKGLNTATASMTQLSTLKQNRKALYDTTAVYALNRLTNALVSLIAPSGQTWHSLEDVSYFTKETEDVKKWLERVNDLLFRIRYTPSSGWSSSIPRVFKSVVGYGQGIMLVQEGSGNVPINYSMKSIKDCYLDVDPNGVYNTCYRTFVYTAEQAVAKFNQGGDKLPPKIVQEAADPQKKDNRYEFMHVVEIRDPSGKTNHSDTADIDKAKFTNDYVCIEENCTVRSGGYFEFPYVVFWWDRDGLDAYGTSPMILALSEVAGLNTMGKDELLMYQKQGRPPYLMSAKGKMRRLNTNPDAMNTGVEWQNGRPMFQEIGDGRGYNFAEAVKASRQQQVGRLLYVDLLQTFADDPNETATKTLERKREKVEQLSAFGDNFRQSGSALLEVEIGILNRKGVFDGEFEEFTTPESVVEGNDIQPRFSSPLDKMRGLGAVEGIQQSYAFAAQIAQATQDPAVFDMFDYDKDMETIAGVLGHPLNNLVDKDEREAIRKSRAEQQAQAQQAAQMPEMAKAASDGANAMATMQGASENVQ